MQSGDQPVAVAQRDAFEDMLYDAQVDLVWGAHHHSYQRSCPSTWACVSSYALRGICM